MTRFRLTAAAAALTAAAAALAAACAWAGSGALAAPCAGPLAMTDADSGRVVGCAAFRIPDVDSPERGTPCGPALAARAKALLDGRPATLDISAARDRYDRLVTSPRLPALGDLRRYVLSRQLAKHRRYGRGWIDGPPGCDAAPLAMRAPGARP